MGNLKLFSRLKAVLFRAAAFATGVAANAGMPCEAESDAASADFSASEHVFFLPHVGKDYGKSSSLFGKRLCVVGASHYAEGFEGCLRGNGRDVWRAMTRNVVRDYLDPDFHAGTRWPATYTRFLGAFFGRAPSAEERRRFFDSVVFFNYLQRPEGAGGRESRPELYADDRHFRAFSEVVSATRPDVIVVWGDKVWGELSRRFPDAEKANAFPRCVRAEIGGRAVVLLGVRHPSSSRFSRDDARGAFAALGILPLPSAAR